MMWVVQADDGRTRRPDRTGCACAFNVHQSSLVNVERSAAASSCSAARVLAPEPASRVPTVPVSGRGQVPASEPGPQVPRVQVRAPALVRPAEAQAQEPEARSVSARLVPAPVQALVPALAPERRSATTPVPCGTGADGARRGLGLAGAGIAGDSARFGAGLVAGGSARTGSADGAATSVCGAGVACSSVTLGATCAAGVKADSLFCALCRAATNPPDATRQTPAMAAETRFLEDNGRCSCSSASVSNK